MEGCIFCKIISGEIPSQKLYEDDRIYVFNDINPEAPVHFLVIPKEHIANVNELTEENSDILAHIFLQIKRLVKELGIDNSGYRVITNTGDDAGQTVHHMHFHVIGKKKLSVKLS